jgi:hypothetical protein
MNMSLPESIRICFRLIWTNIHNMRRQPREISRIREVLALGASILDDTVASLEKALALIQNRHDGGLASGLDWRRSRRYWTQPGPKPLWSGRRA